MDSNWQDTMEKDVSSAQQSDDDNTSMVVKEKVIDEIPSQVFNMMSMPRNWDQVERLKNKKQLLHRHLFSDITKYAETVVKTEDESESEEEMIDIETVSDKNDDSVYITTIATGLDYDGGEEEEEEEEDDDSSEYSVLSLKIVEDEESDEESMDKAVEDECAQDIQKSPEEVPVKGPLQCGDIERKKSNKKCPSKHVGESASQVERICFDDNPDLCQLSATDINNSLFDTIASLKQESPPTTDLKKQTSLESIITRIKSDAESNKSEYHIHKPVASEYFRSVGGSKSDGAIHKSAQRSKTDSNSSKEKKGRNIKPHPTSGLKGNISQLNVKESTCGASSQKPAEVNLEQSDEEPGSSKAYPVKQILKRFLKAQQKADENGASVSKNNDEGTNHHEEKQKELIKKKKSVDGSDEKSQKVGDSEAKQSDREKSVGESSCSPDVPEDKHQNVKAASSDNLYKLKYEWFQNRIKLLKHESKLLELKKQNFEKMNMQLDKLNMHPYLDVLMNKCCSIKRSGNSWVMMNKADPKNKESVSETMLAEDKAKPVVSSPVTGQKHSHPRTDSRECSEEDPLKQPREGDNEKSQPIACTESLIAGTDNSHVDTQLKSCSDTSTVEDRVTQKDKMLPQAKENLVSNDQKSKTEGQSPSQFIVKTSTDFTKTPLTGRSESKLSPCHQLSVAGNGQSSQKDTPKPENQKGVKHVNTIPVKQTKVTRNMTTQPVQLMPHLAVDSDTGKSSKANSVQVTFNLLPSSTRGAVVARPKLPLASHTTAMYCSPSRAPGYQILRPHSNIGKTNSMERSSALAQSAQRPGIPVIPVTLSNVKPPSSRQVVQLPNGQLYAVVNNVLKPAVRQINDKFLPVLTNPALQRGMPLSSPVLTSRACVTNPMLSPIGHIQQTVGRCTPACSKGQSALPGIKSTDVIYKETKGAFQKPTANPSATTSNAKTKPSDSFTQEDVPSCQPGTTSENTAVKQFHNINDTKTDENSTSTAVPGKTVLRTPCSQNMEKKVSDISEEISLYGYPKVATCETAKAKRDEIPNKQMVQDQSETPASSLINADKQSNKDLHDNVNIDTGNGTTASTSISELTDHSALNRSDSPVIKSKGDTLVCSKDVAPLYSNVHNLVNYMRNQNKMSRDLQRRDVKIPDFNKIESYETNIMTRCEGLSEESSMMTDENNNDMPSDKGSIFNDKMDHAGERNSQAICDLTADSDDSSDSIDWKRYVNICKGNPAQDNKEMPDASLERQHIKQTSPSDHGNVVGKGRKRKSSQTLVLPESASQDCMKSTPHQLKPDNEVTKKLVKTKLIILKGEVCDRWQAIKKRTFLCDGLSDASFVHYLLNLEETRQVRMAQVHKHHRNAHTEKARAKTTVTCNGDAGQATQPPSESMSTSCVRSKEARGATSKMTTPAGAAGGAKTNRNETTRKQKKGKSPAKTRSKEKMENYTKKAFARDAATKKNLKRKLEGSIHEAAESVLGKKGKFEFLSETTKKQMSWALKVFMEWLEQRGEDYLSIYMRDAAWLDSKLQLFYIHARTLDGLPYPSKILQTFRRALSMCLTMYSSKTSIKIGISLDYDFDSSNRLLATILRTEENGDVGKNTEQISSGDMKKLYSTKTLSDKDPTSLLNKVFFDVVHYLCKPKMPSHFLENLETHHLSLETDSLGVYYCLVGTGYVPDCDIMGRMYATPSKQDKCPVRTTSLYMSKLDPGCSALFQCPVTDWSQTSSDWYSPVSMKKEDLGSMMENVCNSAQLSQVYTVANVIATP